MQKNVYLDLVRIFAAFMILTVHIGQAVGFDFGVGAEAVKLFFIMSGYFAFFSLEKSDDCLNYYMNRLLRIVPLYYIVLILLFLENIVFAMYYGKVTDAFQGDDGSKFIRYFFFLQCIIPSDNWNRWNNQIGLWTMSAFFVFYLLAPWLYKLIQSFKASVTTFLGYLVFRKLIIIWMKSKLTSYPPEAGIDWFITMNPISVLHCFLLGIVAFYAVKERLSSILIGTLTIGLIVTKFQHFEFELMFAVLLLAACSIDNHSIIPESVKKTISWVSGGTFALYLIHMLVIRAAQMIWYKIGFENKAIHTIYLFVLCVAVSYFIYYGFVIRIERMLKNEWNKKKPIENSSL